MKTFTILEAIEFLNESSYATNKIVNIGYKDIKKDKHTFIVQFESGFKCCLDMDNETIKYD